MVTPVKELQLHSGCDTLSVRFMQWGSLGVFCGLLLLWACSLIAGVTLHGLVHLAFVLAVLQLISNIRKSDGASARVIGTRPASGVPISVSHREFKS